MADSIKGSKDLFNFLEVSKRKFNGQRKSLLEDQITDVAHNLHIKKRCSVGGPTDLKDEYTLFQTYRNIVIPDLNLTHDKEASKILEDANFSVRESLKTGKGTIKYLKDPCTLPNSKRESTRLLPGNTTLVSGRAHSKTIKTNLLGDIIYEDGNTCCEDETLKKSLSPKISPKKTRKSRKLLQLESITTPTSRLNSPRKTSEKTFSLPLTEENLAILDGDGDLTQAQLALPEIRNGEQSKHKRMRSLGYKGPILSLDTLAASNFSTVNLRPSTNIKKSTKMSKSSSAVTLTAYRSKKKLASTIKKSRNSNANQTSVATTTTNTPCGLMTATLQHDLHDEEDEDYLDDDDEAPEGHITNYLQAAAVGSISYLADGNGNGGSNQQPQQHHSHIRVSKHVAGVAENKKVLSSPRKTINALHKPVRVRRTKGKSRSNKALNNKPAAELSLQYTKHEDSLQEGRPHGKSRSAVKKKSNGLQAGGGHGDFSDPEKTDMVGKNSALLVMTRGLPDIHSPCRPGKAEKKFIKGKNLSKLKKTLTAYYDENTGHSTGVNHSSGMLVPNSTVAGVRESFGLKHVSKSVAPNSSSIFKM
eukprot:CAMPEP_0114988498 /NCGR_PEP_ID=MMETSP0216-20121206/9635_1 /TAXON_ID=223996 /ORGANISM="Protocruzia adherens, Strain Boccale" /LENGTH=587 /DNA_ID=CAMNT_0002351291 /DNA_START=33 /DNA_END=1796 /DNA_ORIENTATION=+